MDVRTAVVTGGGSGIGQAVAARLRKDGHQVAVFDIAPSGQELEYKVDVTDRVQIDRALTEVRERLGPVTILVNGAGAEVYKRFINLTWETWSRAIDVNLHSVFHCTQAVLPDMIDAGWGRVVNISSSSTHSGQPFMSSYVSAKSGVNGLTKSLALEYGHMGSRSMLCPRDSSTPRCCVAQKSEGCSAAPSASTSNGRRCAGRDARRTSPPPARSSHRRKPATSLGRSSA